MPLGRSGAVKRISMEREERLVSKGGSTPSGAKGVRQDYQSSKSL